MQLLPPTVITTAATVVGLPFQIRQPPNAQGMAMAVAAQVTVTVATGGTAINVFLQTSFDGGASWVDAALIIFANTPGKSVAAVSSTTSMTAPTAIATTGDGLLSAASVIPGMVGSWWRAKVVSTGTYTGGTTVKVDVSPVMVPAGVGSFN